MSLFYPIIIAVAFVGCRQPQPPSNPSDNLKVLYSKPLIEKSVVDDFLYNLDLYLKSCASGMRGLGNDRDPSNIGAEFLTQIRSDTFFMTDKLMSSAPKSQDMEIVEDLFSGILKTVAYILRVAIDHRRNNLLEYGWLGVQIPARLSIVLISIRLFRHKFEDPQTLKDIQAIMILMGASPKLEAMFNSSPVTFAQNMFRLCKADPTNPKDDDWICLKRVWTFLMAVDYVHICTSDICKSDDFVFMLSRIGPCLTKAAIKDPQSDSNQQLYKTIFQAFINELEAEKTAPNIGSNLFTELSTLSC